MKPNKLVTIIATAVDEDLNHFVIGDGEDKVSHGIVSWRERDDNRYRLRSSEIENLIMRW
jgi:hypothetical protein